MIFDAHFHILEPAFALVRNEGFLPAPFTTEDYLGQVVPLGIGGGAVVSGSFQGFDQSYLVHALSRLGAGYVGVTQLPATAPDSLLVGLDRQGVRGLRFNLRRGGSESLEQLNRFANRVFDLLHWHVELYVEGRHLASLEKLVARLPAVSIDHLGLTRAGLPCLLRLVEAGVKVKASGFGRVDFPLRETQQAQHAANPRALMFGTDLPSTRAPRPFRPTDILLLQDALGQDGAAAALWQNAVDFYRLRMPVASG